MAIVCGQTVRRSDGQLCLRWEGMSAFAEIPLLIHIGAGVVCVTVLGGVLEIVGGEGEVGVGAEAVEGLA